MQVVVERQQKGREYTGSRVIPFWKAVSPSEEMVGGMLPRVQHYRQTPAGHAFKASRPAVTVVKAISVMS